jgi:ABC-type polysaccharide/polyol phosphate transport system ATPase subunit
VTSILAEDIGVRFLFDRQRRLVTPMLARLRRRGAEVWGLRHLGLTVEHGEGVALIGPSGSGKTTLLRTIAGVLVPDEGRVAVRGRIGSLLSVEAGLVPALTGRENSVLLAALIGLPRPDPGDLEEVKARSGLGEAYERPVASFSQGMHARLGFALIERSRPDILLLDEVHEALDEEFRDVIVAFARRLREAGGILVAAGHDYSLLGRLCERAVVLERGSVRADRPFAEARPAAAAESV